MPKLAHLHSISILGDSYKMIDVVKYAHCMYVYHVRSQIDNGSWPTMLSHISHCNTTSVYTFEHNSM